MGLITLKDKPFLEYNPETSKFQTFIMVDIEDGVYARIHKDELQRYLNCVKDDRHKVFLLEDCGFNTSKLRQFDFYIRVPLYFQFYGEGSKFLK